MQNRSAAEKDCQRQPNCEQSESINKSGFRKRLTLQNDPIGFALIHSPSVLSVSFNSLCSLLRSCLRQSISLGSVVVNSAGFRFKNLLQARLRREFRNAVSGLTKHCPAVAYSAVFSVSSVVKFKPVRFCFLHFENCINKQ